MSNDKKAPLNCDSCHLPVDGPKGQDCELDVHRWKRPTVFATVRSLEKAPAPAQTTEKCPACESDKRNIRHFISLPCVRYECAHPWHLEAAAYGPQNDRNSPTLLFIGNWLAEKNDDRLIRSRIRFNHFEVAEIAESYAASLRSQLANANEELKWRRGTSELMRQAVNGQLASLRESWNAEVAVSSGLRSQLEQVTKERDQAYSRREHTHNWYASHYGKLHDWARKRLPEPWQTEFFSCIANGTWGHDDLGKPYMSQVGRIVPSGYVKFDTSQEQILHEQSERAELAESSLASTSGVAEKLAEALRELLSFGTPPLMIKDGPKKCWENAQAALTEYEDLRK